MLPVYHRPHDAKLLLLTIPACAILLNEGGAIGRIARLLNCAAIVLTADLPLAMLVKLIKGLHLSTDDTQGKILTVLAARPIPVVLLALAVFYLWVYLHRCLGADTFSGAQSQASPVISAPSS